MSFHEKSAWACLVALLLVFVPYFLLVFWNPMAFVAFFIFAVAILVSLLTAFHVMNAVATPSIRKTGDVPVHDELDRLIELKASKRSGIVLGVVVLIWSIAAMLGAPAIGVSGMAEAGANHANEAGFGVPVLHALIAVHLLFAGFVAANIIYYGSIVASYRRLAHG